VLLCTRALTGVGADIAAGNQFLKGKIADLVIKPTKRGKVKTTLTIKLLRVICRRIMNQTIKISPKRLVIRVNNALDNLTLFI
jgi:hypothetical protein